MLRGSHMRTLSTEVFKKLIMVIKNNAISDSCNWISICNCYWLINQVTAWRKLLWLFDYVRTKWRKWYFFFTYSQYGSLIIINYGKLYALQLMIRKTCMIYWLSSFAFLSHRLPLSTSSCVEPIHFASQLIFSVEC